MTGEPDGYEVPMHTSLTSPILLAGVPREYAIMNATLAAALTLGLHVWWIGVPLGIVGHSLGAWMTKRDANFFEVLRRHLWQRTNLEG